MTDHLKYCNCGCIYTEDECPNCNKVTPLAAWLEALDQIAELEAKLAKAVAFAEIVERAGHGELEFLAGDMLAELKVQKDE